MKTVSLFAVILAALVLLPAIAIGDSRSEIIARAEAIIRNSEAQQQELQQSREKLAVARVSIQGISREYEKKLAEQAAEYEKRIDNQASIIRGYETDPWVQWALLIKRCFRFLIALYVIIGVIGAVTGLFSGFAWPYHVSKIIVRAIPFGNWVRWLQKAFEFIAARFKK